MGRAIVLLVDDEPHIPMVVGKKLAAAGFDVITASDGEEGLAAAKEATPDLIITDLQMPFMSGAELAEAVRATPEIAHVPIVLLTARGYVLSEEQRERNDITHVLSKPFSVTQILELVSGMLDERGSAEAA